MYKLKLFIIIVVAQTLIIFRGNIYKSHVTITVNNVEENYTNALARNITLYINQQGKTDQKYIPCQKLGFFWSFFTGNNQPSEKKKNSRI